MREKISKYYALILSILVLIIVIFIYARNYFDTVDEGEFAEVLADTRNYPAVVANHQNEYISYYQPKEFELVEDTNSVLLTKGNEAIQMFYGTGEIGDSSVIENEMAIDQSEILYEEIVDPSPELHQYVYLKRYDDDRLQFITGENDRYITGIFYEDNLEEYLMEIYLMYNSVQENVSLDDSTVHEESEKNVD